jgi:type I restriction enzyme S subunit
MLDIPPHWKTVKLGEVCFTTSGGTPSRKKTDFYNGNIPWVKSGELEHNIILDTEEKITEDALKNSSAKVFPKGTLLIALYGATIGKLAILGIDAATNQAICGIFKSDHINQKFLYWFLFNYKQKLINLGIGGAQPNISQGILKETLIPLPPLPEQHLIVAKIEELFSELDNAVENLKKAKEQLKVYRQALLKWAFEGKLTEEWRKERESQNTEYQSEKEEVRMAAEEIIKYSSNNELPVGWKWFKLAELTEVKDGTHDTPKYVSDGIPFITQKNIREEGLTFSNVQYITQKDHDKFFRRSNVTFNDILISMIGANRGMSCIVNDNRTFSIKNVGLIKSNTNNFDQLYLLYFLKSSYSRNYVKSLSKGGAQEFVGLTELRNFPILKCPILEQYQIVQEIETRFSVADKLELSIDQSLQQAEALRQSILNKAFEGRLASTNALPSSEGSGVGH